MSIAGDSIARWREVRILFWQPSEILASPDASVLIAEARGRDECGDAELVKVPVVGARAVLRIRDGGGNAELAEPAMLPQHFCEELLLCGRASRHHGCGDHLPASSANRDMRLVGEVAAKLRPVDQRGLRIGATHDLFIGPFRPTCPSARTLILSWARRRPLRLALLVGLGLLVKTLEVLAHRQRWAEHLLPSPQRRQCCAGPNQGAVHVHRPLRQEPCFSTQLDGALEESFEHLGPKRRLALDRTLWSGIASSRS